MGTCECAAACAERSQLSGDTTRQRITTRHETPQLARRDTPRAIGVAPRSRSCSRDAGDPEPKDVAVCEAPLIDTTEPTVASAPELPASPDKTSVVYDSPCVMEGRRQRIMAERERQQKELVIDLGAADFFTLSDSSLAPSSVMTGSFLTGSMASMMTGSMASMLTGSMASMQSNVDGRETSPGVGKPMQRIGESRRGEDFASGDDTPSRPKAGSRSPRSGAAEGVLAALMVVGGPSARADSGPAPMQRNAVRRHTAPPSCSPRQPRAPSKSARAPSRSPRQASRSPRSRRKARSRTERLSQTGDDDVTSSAPLVQAAAAFLDLDSKVSVASVPASNVMRLSLSSGNSAEDDSFEQTNASPPASPKGGNQRGRARRNTRNVRGNSLE